MGGIIMKKGFKIFRFIAILLLIGILLFLFQVPILNFINPIIDNIVVPAKFKSYYNEDFVIYDSDLDTEPIFGYKNYSYYMHPKSDNSIRFVVRGKGLLGVLFDGYLTYDMSSYKCALKNKAASDKLSSLCSGASLVLPVDITPYPVMETLSSGFYSSDYNADIDLYDCDEYKFCVYYPEDYDKISAFREIFDALYELKLPNLDVRLFFIDSGKLASVKSAYDDYNYTWDYIYHLNYSIPPINSYRISTYDCDYNFIALPEEDDEVIGIPYGSNFNVEIGSQGIPSEDDKLNYPIYEKSSQDLRDVIWETVNFFRFNGNEIIENYDAIIEKLESEVAESVNEGAVYNLYHVDIK